MPARRSTALLLASTLILPVAAGAQERTPPDLSPEPAAAGTVEDARDLRAALEGYLTATPFDLGALRVEPDEAGLRIVLDPSELAGALTGRPVEFSPISFVVSERTDGDWNVFWNDPFQASGPLRSAARSRARSTGRIGRPTRACSRPRSEPFSRWQAKAARRRRFRPTPSRRGSSASWARPWN